MAKFKAKHTVEEIDGVRCTVVDTGIDEKRLVFLKEILEFNKFEVKIEKDKKKDETAPDTYKIGVTNIVFNPTIAIFERTLKHKSGKIITPKYWLQETNELKPHYWVS